MPNNEIKTSSCTQEFETGSHRDNAAGKGRCDLLPLEVVSEILYDDPVCMCVHEFMESRNPSHLIDAIHESVETVPMFRYEEIAKELESKGIVLSHTETKMDYWDMMIPCLAHMMLEVSVHYENGANLYGANNWTLGQPCNRLINSGMRHYLKVLRGDTDEPHYRAFIWNLLCCIWMAKNKPELNFKEEPKKSNKNKES